MSTIAVVGASGPLGLFLTGHLAHQGHAVRALSRGAGDMRARVDVLEHDPTIFLQGVDAVVYCAWSTADRSEAAQQAHVAATARWARACEAGGTAFVFTSTVLAAATGTSSYGRHKHQAEQAVEECGGISLRIGLVTDDSYPFLATRVRRLSQRLPVAARLLDVPVYAVGTPAVGAAVTAELARPRPGAVVWLAPDRPTSLQDVALHGTRDVERRPAGADGGGLLRLAARVPLKRGGAGRQVDALRGLLAAPTRSRHLVDPASGPVAQNSWLEPLRRADR